MAEEASTFLSTQRYAVVTGANRGMGLEICRQLASNGVMVVLTARDEKKGIEALEKLKENGLSHLVVFHQLDLLDPSTISSLADFIKTQFGRLDILVNNAAIGGITVDTEALKASEGREGIEIDWKAITSQTYSMGEKCLETNYFGAKRIIQALLPLLLLSDSPRIVNVSSTAGKLQYVSNEWAVGVLSDAENLTEHKVDEILTDFMKDFKEDQLESKNWPTYLSAYILSKASMNAYTRILAKTHSHLMINCVCPGYVKTNSYAGLLTVEEGASSPVRLALLPQASTFLATRRYAVVTGANRGIGFEICRQLASKGVMVVMTARDEKKGIEALEKFKEFGLSELVMFHQLDVVDPSSVASLAHFIKIQFGKLDILVNNAAITGIIVDSDFVRLTEIDLKAAKLKWVHHLMTQTYSLGEECLEINYYGVKRMIEALIPLLDFSDSPRIVNVSSSSGKLKFLPNEWAKGVFLDDESLTEERIEAVLNKFMKDFKDGELEANCWPSSLSAYTLAKASLNAYTKILAKRHKRFIVNSVCPGYVKTDMNCNTGNLTVEEGGENIVRLALLPEDGPSGLFFFQKEVSPL
ncbi:unnamed protein product [Camellia sinensis]